MENFETYNTLPIGVIVFKNKKVDLVNKYLKDILSVSFFSQKNAIDVIMRMTNVESEEELFFFFTDHEYFKTQNKTIQIEYHAYDEYFIFVFTSINQNILNNNTEVVSMSDSSYIDVDVSKHFKLKNISKVIVLTFYKGVPLKKVAKIARINQDSIEILVDAKHNISLEERNDVILMTNQKKDASVLHGQIVKSVNNIFTIRNFFLTKDDMHLRNGLRVKPDRKMTTNVKEEEFDVYDISSNGISITISTQEDEAILKALKSMKVSFLEKEIELAVHYLKTVKENDKYVKIIFKISTFADDSVFLNKYIIEKQNEILREIHNFKT